MRMGMAAVLVMLLATGCASYKVSDSNAAVDGNPLCASRADRPGEPVAAGCERKAEASWSTGSRESTPVEFGRKKDD